MLLSLPTALAQHQFSLDARCNSGLVPHMDLGAVPDSIRRFHHNEKSADSRPERLLGTSCDGLSLAAMSNQATALSVVWAAMLV